MAIPYNLVEVKLAYNGTVTQISIENLDAEQSSTDLLKYAEQYKAIAAQYESLAYYAKAKARAIDFRRAGMIPQALKCEQAADAEYQKLDDAFRW